jgi:phage gp29-like protein
MTENTQATPSQPIEATDARKNLPATARGLIATARNDITIPFFTTVLSVVDDTLIQRGGGKGLKIYDEIERDTHAYAVIQKRKFALIGRELVVEAASENALDKKAAAFVEETLKRINFDQLCLDLLDATLKGFSVAEIVWARLGNAIVPESIIAHDPRRFTFDEAWTPRLLTREAPLVGIDLPDRKFITHRFGVKGNNPYGLGLGSKLFWPVLFKREGVAFWLTFLEKFASPTPVGKYPLGMLPADQNLLLANLEGMSQAGAIVVPIGTELSFMEATRAGQVGYKEWCAYWDMQMALCVFGSTLATHIEGQGSRAAAETHKEAEEQIIDADADLLSDTLRKTLIKWLVDYNVPGAELPLLKRIRPKNEIAHEDLRKKRADNMKLEMDRLFDLAAKVQPESFVEMAAALAGIDLMPQVPVEVLQKLAPHLAMARENLVRAAKRGELAMPQNDNDAAALRQVAFASTNSGHDHGMGDLARQLDDIANPFIGGWVDRIRLELDAAIANGDGMEAFSERLLAIDPELSLDELGDAISGAAAVAELTGCADVADMQAAKRKR